MSPDTSKKRKADAKPSPASSKRPRADDAAAAAAARPSKSAQTANEPKNEKSAKSMHDSNNVSKSKSTITSTSTSTSTKRAPPRPALMAPHESVIAQLSTRNDVLPASVISSTKIGKRTTYIMSHLLPHSADEQQGAAGSAAAAEGAGAGAAEPGRPRVAVLYARPADVCKMITVAELCKRSLGEKGRPWFQYNEMFTLPEEEREKKKKKKKKKTDAVTSRQKEDGKRRKLGEGQAGERENDEDEDKDERGEEHDEEGRKKEEKVQEGEEDSEEDAFEPVPSRFENAMLPPPKARTTMSLRIFLSLEPIPDLRSRPDITIQSSEERR